MKTQLSKLIRPDLQNFSGYQPGVWVDPSLSKIIKLDSGENPYINPKYAYYPDSQCLRLRTKLSAYTGLNISQIVCGNGSDELIDLVIRVFIDPGDELIINPPTFAMYKFYGLLNRAKIISIPRLNNLEIDIPNIIKTIGPKTKLIFVDSPGNPAGTITNQAQLEQLLNLNVIVCVDEAYFEYCGQSCVSLLRIYPNLIILRTFSKWAGLASLRLGYLLANPTLISVINSIKSPYNVSTIAQIEGIKSLNNISKIRCKLTKLISLRNQFIKRLSAIPTLKVLPSQSAYIVFRPPEALDFQNYLISKSIIIKKLTSPPLENYFRLNLGRPIDIKLTLSAIAKFYKPKFLIFDIDGTLVDVSQSYREAIRLTAQDFLNRKITTSEVDQIKSKPGMNNDWDATFALISTTPNPTLYQQVKIRFQKYYLGSQNLPGLINNEKLLIKKSVLKSLTKKYQLAIVTGRPKKEARYVLKKLGIFSCFSSNPIICLEDTDLGKPYPDSILKCLKIIKSKSAIYIGDSINDALAASKANIPCLCVGSQKLGDKQLTNVNKLPKMLKSIYG